MGINLLERKNAGNSSGYWRKQGHDVICPASLKASGIWKPLPWGKEVADRSTQRIRISGHLETVARRKRMWWNNYIYVALDLGALLEFFFCLHIKSQRAILSLQKQITAFEGKIYTKIVTSMGFFIQDSIFLVVMNPFLADCIHLHLNYKPVNLFHLILSGAAWGWRLKWSKQLGCSQKSEFWYKENVVHNTYPHHQWWIWSGLK